MWQRKAQEWYRAMLVWIKRECMKLLLCQVTYCSSYGKSLIIKLSSLCSLSHCVQHALTVRITGRWSCCFLCVSPRVIDACGVQLEIMSFFTWVSLPAWTPPIQMRCSSASRGPAEDQRGVESLPQEAFCCALFSFCIPSTLWIGWQCSGYQGIRYSVHGCWCHKLESHQQQEGIREFFLPSKCCLQSLERIAWDLMGKKHSSPHTTSTCQIIGKIAFMLNIWLGNIGELNK